jgi:hypothetical protein
MTREQYLALMESERSQTSSVSSEQAYAQYRQMNGLTRAVPPSEHSSNGPEAQAPSTEATAPPMPAKVVENTA